jgi:hypothetical protein
MECKFNHLSTVDNFTLICCSEGGKEELKKRPRCLTRERREREKREREVGDSELLMGRNIIYHWF